VRREPVRAGRVFDVQLAATMVTNGVRRIHTFNRSDFERFADFEVLTPE
jgi:predicted nucleic acid-binding protein